MSNSSSKKVRKRKEDKLNLLLPIIFKRIIQNPDLLKLPHGLNAIEIYFLKKIGLWPLPTQKRGIKKKRV